MRPSVESDRLIQAVDAVLLAMQSYDGSVHGALMIDDPYWVASVTGQLFRSHELLEALHMLKRLGVLVG